MADRFHPTRALPVSLVARDPLEARRRAARVLAEAPDPRARTAALRVSGLAAHELGSPDEALRRLGAAVRVAALAGLAEETALARASRSGLLARSGLGRGPEPRHSAAFAFTLMNHGTAACQNGRFDTALDAFTAAEPAFAAFPDPRLLPGFLCNKGLALVHADRLGEAEDALSWGLLLAERYALGHLRGSITQNLGCLAAARGDTARAMEYFDAAAPLLDSGTRRTALVLDRALALADAGMVREAGTLRRSLGDARGRGAERALTELLSLKLHAARGDTEAAAATGHRLRLLFDTGSLWLRLAEQAAATRPGPVPMPPREEGRPGGGFPLPTATPHLELTSRAESAAPARALRDAGAAVRAGEAAAALVHVELAREPASSPRACTDPEWAMLLDRYRSAHARAASGSAAARRELTRLESELAVAQWHPRCRHRRRSAFPRRRAGEPLAELAAGLGDRAFVCYPELEGLPAALTLVEGRVRIHPLPSAGAVGDAVVALEHLARLNASSPGPRTAELLARRASVVNRMLVGPVAAAVGDRELVVAPGPRTQALPWGLLPGLRGRPVSVAPSGRAWLRCRKRARDAARARPRTLLVSGPGLVGAEAEVRALADRRPDARVLTGPGAVTREVLRELSRADLAHIGAHGFAPDDAPMCAGLSLADGPLFAYDLERVRRAPALTVLSSCEAGRSASAASGVPLGMAAALLARGGAAVVASVLPVPDGATATAMARAHSALRSGVPPAEAVSEHLAATGFVCFGAG
ncbi:CHAT domain-containing protein [Actinorugispora endophytica]|uniref:CHAT domain-containing protein n=1 Tax=Actinorugispora endophytica TaxID=1605990 RepID=A0A4R6UXC8_9ACTN|nr:CHAT domain-containing protein [Actinorugispora endophytica]TDQ48254.1 CHAT domain-containing protein [Actinorugispora endophytica]